jgi:histidinol-phosphate phosphatase family protein
MANIATIFLDRDGVINRNRPQGDYVKSWEEFEFLPGARSAIARLTQAGFLLLVVTNQACVGKGIVSWAMMQEIHARMMQEIARAGGQIEGVLCCPHQADDGCDCRKPAPGLLIRAHQEYGVDLKQAILVGDSAKDVQAAAAVGMQAIMVLSGIGRTADLESTSPPCCLALDLSHAAQLILNGEVTAPDEISGLEGDLRRQKFDPSKPHEQINNTFQMNAGDKFWSFTGS